MPSPGPSGTAMWPLTGERLREQVVAQRVVADVVLDQARSRHMVGVRIVGQRRDEVERGREPDGLPQTCGEKRTLCSWQSSAIALASSRPPQSVRSGWTTSTARASIRRAKSNTVYSASPVATGSGARRASAS